MRVQKRGYDLHVLLALLELGHVARLREGNPAHMRDALEPRRDGRVARLVVEAVDQQRRYRNLGRVVEHRPRLERARDVELGWAVPGRASATGEGGEVKDGAHGKVDGRVLLYELEAGHKVGWHGRDAADKLSVEREHRGLILGGLCRSGLFVFRERVLPTAVSTLPRPTL